MSTPLPAIIGGAICVASLSWNRMGPAYLRRRIAPSTFIIGLILILSWDFDSKITDDFLCSFYDSCGTSDLSSVLRYTAIWLALLVSGVALALNGAGSYGDYSIPSLSVGWIMILASVILSLVFHPSGLLTVDTLIKSLPVIVGIMIGLLSIIGLTALSENFEPPLPPAPGLADDERDAMLSSLAKHLGGGGE